LKKGGKGRCEREHEQGWKGRMKGLRNGDGGPGMESGSGALNRREWTKARVAKPPGKGTGKAAGSETVMGCG